jgi:hypothetical protein
VQVLGLGKDQNGRYHQCVNTFRRENLSFAVQHAKTANLATLEADLGQYLDFSSYRRMGAASSGSDHFGRVGGAPATLKQCWGKQSNAAQRGAPSTTTIKCPLCAQDLMLNGSPDMVVGAHIDSGCTTGLSVRAPEAERGRPANDDDVPLAQFVRLPRATRAHATSPQVNRHPGGGCGVSTADSIVISSDSGESSDEIEIVDEEGGIVGEEEEELVVAPGCRSSCELESVEEERGAFEALERALALEMPGVAQEHHGESAASICAPCAAFGRRPSPL